MAFNCCPDDDFSPESISKNGCPFSIPGDCVYYTGSPIAGIGINSGDSFNTVVRKLALYFGGINSSISNLEEDVDTLGLGLGTSTTTTTTTTGGTTTSTTSTSTTTTTTTTAAPGSDTIYMGAKASGTAPTEGQILAGTTSTQDGSDDVTLNWTSLTSSAQFVWFAIPALGTAYNKNHWYVNAGNQGAIGTGDDLFGAPATVSVNGENYYVWISNYATQFTAPTLLQRV